MSSIALSRLLSFPDSHINSPQAVVIIIVVIIIIIIIINMLNLPASFA